MAYIIPNEGDNHILSAAFQVSGTMELRLFTNDVTLSATMTVTALTEMTAGGYGGKTILATAWCVPYLTAGSAEVSASGNNANGFQFTFTAAPNQTAYGYWVENDQNKLVVVEKFASSYYLANAGDTLTIKPKVRAT
jgi:hypothetical protein